MEFKWFKEGKEEIKTERNNEKMIELEIPVGLKNCWWWGDRRSDLERIKAGSQLVEHAVTGSDEVRMHTGTGGCSKVKTQSERTDLKELRSRAKEPST